MFVPLGTSRLCHGIYVISMAINGNSDILVLLVLGRVGVIHGPMNQVQVQIVSLQILQSLGETGSNIVMEHIPANE